MFTSCSESNSYVELSDIVRKDGQFLYEGESFSGIGVNLWGETVNSSWIFEQFKLIEFRNHGDSEKTKEIKLRNGKTCLLGDIITDIVDLEHMTFYHDDGSLNFQTENDQVEGDDLYPMFKNEFNHE